MCVQNHSSWRSIKNLFKKCGQAAQQFKYTSVGLQLKLCKHGPKDSLHGRLMCLFIAPAPSYSGPWPLNSWLDVSMNPIDSFVAIDRESGQLLPCSRNVE